MNPEIRSYLSESVSLLRASFRECLAQFLRPTVGPLRSCDCHDGGHMTTVVRRRAGAHISGRSSWPVYLF